MIVLGRTHLFAAALVALLAGAAAPPASAQTAVFVVRHAEKVDESEDPLLSAKGKARAQALARHLKSAGIKSDLRDRVQADGPHRRPAGGRPRPQADRRLRRRLPRRSSTRSARTTRTA